MARPHGGLDWRVPGYYDAALARWDTFNDNDPVQFASEEERQAVEQIHAGVMSALGSPPSGWRKLIYSRWMVAFIYRQHSGNIAKASKRAGQALDAAVEAELIEQLEQVTVGRLRHLAPRGDLARVQPPPRGGEAADDVGARRQGSGHLPEGPR